MQPPDVLTALQTLLKSDAGIMSLSDGRVYRTTLPKDDASYMPRSAVVLSRAGGLPDRAYLPYARHRVDVRCYGYNVSQAYQLWAAVHSVFKYLRPRVVGNCRIYACDSAGGSVDTVEPEARWPLQWSSYLVTYSEAAVAA